MSVYLSESRFTGAPHSLLCRGTRRCSQVPQEADDMQQVPPPPTHTHTHTHISPVNLLDALILNYSIVFSDCFQPRGYVYVCVCVCVCVCVYVGGGVVKEGGEEYEVVISVHLGAPPLPTSCTLEFALGRSAHSTLWQMAVSRHFGRVWTSWMRVKVRAAALWSEEPSESICITASSPNLGRRCCLQPY